jgi:hypothetical protein
MPVQISAEALTCTTPGPCAGCQLQGWLYCHPTTVPFKQLPPLASSWLSSPSSVLLLLPLLPLIIIVVIKPRSGIPCKRIALPGKVWSAPTQSIGGDNRSPGRRSAGSMRAPLESPPPHCLLHHRCSACAQWSVPPVFGCLGWHGKNGESVG